MGFLDAAGKGAQTESSKTRRGGLLEEECAESMGKRRNDAAVMDAQIKLRTVELALSMRQKSTGAAVKDAQTKLEREVCVLCREHTATPLKGGEGLSMY